MLLGLIAPKDKWSMEVLCVPKIISSAITQYNAARNKKPKIDLTMPTKKATNLFVID